MTSTAKTKSKPKASQAKPSQAKPSPAKSSPTKSSPTKSSQAKNFSFATETDRLLDIVTHSLYGEREVFLRELIANAADATDKLRLMVLQDSTLSPGFQPRIDLSIDKKRKVLVIADNGAGMNDSELADNLGTIARSGTRRFLEDSAAAQSAKPEGAAATEQLIGQFGVGFYACFMVAKEVTLLARRVGEHKTWRWHADLERDRNHYSIAEADSKAERDTHGVTIELRLTDDAAKEFLEPARIEHVVKKWSNHLTAPIFLSESPGGDSRQINSAKAPWRSPKISDSEAESLYTELAGFGQYWEKLAVHLEGILETRALLFIPKERPFDLFDPQRQRRLKLYVRQVFITDRAESLLPSWLRFVTGVIDSDDLPLTISREMLKNEPAVRKISQQLSSRLVKMLSRKLEQTEEDYQKFFENFGSVLKEGLCQEGDAKPREALLEACLFYSDREKKPIRLKDYVESMAKKQKEIYVLTGTSREALESSPHLEGFRQRHIDVLLLSDAIDEFWLPVVGSYRDKELKTITREAIDLSKIGTASSDGDDEQASDHGGAKGDKESSKAEPAHCPNLIARAKDILGDGVENVQEADNLVDTPVVLLSPHGVPHLEKMLQAHGQLDREMARVLALNPRHELIKALENRPGYRIAL